MNLLFNLSLLPLLAGLLAMGPADTPDQVTRLVIRDQVILRVPVAPHPRTLRRIEWLERKGPKCIQSAMVRKAMLSGPQQVDFLLANRSRMRVKFDQDCPALDFYAGLYLKTEDDMLCVQRDAIHSRMGGSCTIERFQFLVPQLREVAAIP